MVILILTYTLICLGWNAQPSQSGTQDPGPVMNATIGRTLSDTSLLQTNLEKAIELARSTLSLIRNRYELDGVHGGQFFLDGEQHEG